MECPKCESKNIVHQDDSFDHEFGTESIIYDYCEDCDWIDDIGERGV